MNYTKKKNTTNHYRNPRCANLLNLQLQIGKDSESFALCQLPLIEKCSSVENI